MFCWFCSATTTDTRLLATIFHFWARTCSGCAEKYGEKDADGKLVYQAEPRHVQ